MRGLTQQELADLVKTHRPTITMLEIGQQEGGAVLISSLAHALGVSADWLLDLAETPDGHNDGSAYQLGYNQAVEDMQALIEGYFKPKVKRSDRTNWGTSGAWDAMRDPLA